MAPRPARITDRDRLLLAFLAEHRLALSAHVQVLLAVSARTADARLHALRATGLLGSERPFHAQPRCWWVTRRGLAAVESTLAPPRFDLHAHRHDVGLAWLWLAARRGVFGPLNEVVSERRMRSQDGAESHPARTQEASSSQFAVRLGGIGPGGHERLHYPDLLLITERGRRVAVELELSTKPRVRRERILSGYGADARIDLALYLVESPSVARALRTSAARLGISTRIQVQRVECGGQSARASAREAARLRERVPRSKAFQR